MFKEASTEITAVRLHIKSSRHVEVFRNDGYVQNGASSDLQSRFVTDNRNKNTLYNSLRRSQVIF